MHVPLCLRTYLSEWTFSILSFFPPGEIPCWIERNAIAVSEIQLMFLKMPYGFVCCCCAVRYVHTYYILRTRTTAQARIAYIVSTFCFQFTKPHFGRSLLNFFVCVCVCSEYKFGALFVINACNNKDTISSGGDGNKRYYLEFWPRIPLPFTLAHMHTQRQLCPQKT